VVLFVGGEDEVVEELAARDGTVVSEKGVNQPRAILEIAVVAHDEAHGLAPVEDAAAVPDDPVDQLDTFPDLGWLSSVGVDRQVFELVGTLDVAVGPGADILDDPRVLDHRLVADGTVVATTAVGRVAG
jgi:hypothetical protein